MTTELPRGLPAAAAWPAWSSPGTRARAAQPSAVQHAQRIPAQRSRRSVHSAAHPASRRRCGGSCPCPRRPGRCACRPRGCTAAQRGAGQRDRTGSQRQLMHARAGRCACRPRGRTAQRSSARQQRGQQQRRRQCSHLLAVGRALELGKVGVGVHGAQEDGLELVHARIAAQQAEGVWRGEGRMSGGLWHGRRACTGACPCCKGGAAAARGRPGRAGRASGAAGCGATPAACNQLAGGAAHAACRLGRLAAAGLQRRVGAEGTGSRGGT